MTSGNHGWQLRTRDAWSRCRHAFMRFTWVLSAWSITRVIIMEIHIHVTYIILCLCSSVCQSLHLQGRWKTTNFFLFLTKFGFQKTDPEKMIHTQGVIYGNITTNANFTTNLQLVVVDSEYFIQFYGNRTLPTKEACPKMFNKIDTLAFDAVCFPRGVVDFLRKVPCKKGELCFDEDNPSNVIPGYQFTYKVRDTERPR